MGALKTHNLGECLDESGVRLCMTHMLHLYAAALKVHDTVPLYGAVFTPTSVTHHISERVLNRLFTEWEKFIQLKPNPTPDAA